MAPGMIVSGSTGWAITMVLGGSASYSCQPAHHHTPPVFLSSSCTPPSAYLPRPSVHHIPVHLSGTWASGCLLPYLILLKLWYTVDIFSASIQLEDICFASLILLLSLPQPSPLCYFPHYNMRTLNKHLFSSPLLQHHFITLPARNQSSFFLIKL